MKNIKIKREYVLIIIAVLLACVFTVTLAYFSVQVLGNSEGSSGVSTGTFEINVSDNEIEVDSLAPIYDNYYELQAYKKTFTVSSDEDSTLNSCTNIYLQIDTISEGLKSEYLKYILVSNGETVGEGNFQNATNTEDFKLNTTSAFIKAGESVEYTLYIWISYEEEIDQMSLLGTTLSGIIKAVGRDVKNKGTCLNLGGEVYSLAFNANGGEEILSSKEVIVGATYGILPTPTKIGYRFLGWFTSINGGTRITESTVVELTDDQMLYAQWELLGPVESYSCANGSAGSHPYVLTYTGDCEMIDDGNNNWRVKFLTDGNLTITKNLGYVDVFAVGGGGGGASAGSPANWVVGGGGGGGGYTATVKKISLALNTEINVEIGDGGAATASNIYSNSVTNGNQGGTSSFGTYVSANGGNGGYYDGRGGAGGSGGGGGTEYTTNPGNGGSNGSNGGNSQKAGGAGQLASTGINTSEFGEEYDKETYIYSPGGGGATGRPGSSTTQAKGSVGAGLTGDNSGAGGTGGAAINQYVSGGGSAGSSGIVILRNNRTEDAIIIDDNKLSLNSNVLGYYSGEANVIDEGNNNWRIEFLTDGKFIYSGTSNIDIFLVGGGGGGGDGYNNAGGGGGGSGYVATYSNISLINSDKYTFEIGDGGAASQSGGATQIIHSDSILYTASGGSGGYRSTGGNGASGGGAGGSHVNEKDNSGGSGGTNGSSGNVNAQGLNTPGTGSGKTTYLFGDSSLTLYSTGGNGGAGKYCRDNNNDGEYNSCTCNDNAASPGSDNTGNGGDGGPCSGTGGSGGSGIIVIRNAR